MSSILNGKKKANNLSGIKAVLNQQGYTTTFDPKNGNGKNGNGKNGNGKNGNGFRNPQNRLALGTGNDWSDPLLLTPRFRTLDKSIDVSL